MQEAHYSNEMWSVMPRAPAMRSNCSMEGLPLPQLMLFRYCFVQPIRRASSVSLTFFSAWLVSGRFLFPCSWVSIYHLLFIGAHLECPHAPGAAGEGVERIVGEEQFALVERTRVAEQPQHAVGLGIRVLVHVATVEVPGSAGPSPRVSSGGGPGVCVQRRIS